MIPSFAASRVSRRNVDEARPTAYFNLFPGCVMTVWIMGRRVRRGYGTSSSYSDNKAWRSPAIKIRYANSPAYFSIMVYCACRLLHARRTLERLDELIPQEWSAREGCYESKSFVSSWAFLCEDGHGAKITPSLMLCRCKL